MRNPIRLLIVDDSATSRVIVARALGEGYEIAQASSAEEALGLLERRTPDLVLLDLLMPGMGGLGFLSALKDRGLDLPVLVVTADIQASTKERVAALGARGLVNKPPKPEELRAAVEAALGAGRAESHGPAGAESS